MAGLMLGGYCVFDLVLVYFKTKVFENVECFISKVLTICEDVVMIYL